MSELQSLTQLAQFVLPAEISCNQVQQHELRLARPSILKMVSFVAAAMQIVITVLEEITQIAHFVLPDFTCNLYLYLQQHDLLRARTNIFEVVSSVPSAI